jgi:hypothetical protein
MIGNIEEAIEKSKILEAEAAARAARQEKQNA